MSKIVASLKDTILFQDILKLSKKLIDDERIDRKTREEYEQKLKEIALEDESEDEHMVKMNQGILNLINLIKQNPELPIIPMVDKNILANEDYDRYLGSIGLSRVDFCCFDDDEILFKNNTDEEDYEYKLNWVECIVVNIDMP